MQAPNQPGPPLWTKIGYIALALLLVLLAYNLGTMWIGHIVLIVSAFLFLRFFVQPDVRPLAGALLALGVLILLLSTALTQFFSFLYEEGYMARNDLLDTLFGTVQARALVSVLIAGLLSTLVLAVLVTLAVWISSDWILAMREEHKVTRAQALRLLFSMFFRTAYPYHIVEEGEIKQSKPGGLLPLLGGPGVVVIKPYNAVVFERSGDVTRIEGPGLIRTKRFEFTKAIVDLRKQWITFAAEDVLTKDQVPLTFECGIGFRIESRKNTAKRVEDPSEPFEGGRFVGIIGGDYPAYKRTIYRAVYNTTAAGWKVLSQGATETQLRSVVRQYRLEQLYRLEEGELAEDEPILDEIGREVQRRVSEISHTWGTIITAFTIKCFEAPEDLKERLLEMWAQRYVSRTQLIGAQGTAEAWMYEVTSKAEGELKAALKKAEARIAAGHGERDYLIEVGKGHAEARAELFRTILGALCPGGTPLEPKTIDAIAEQLSVRVGVEDAIRYLGALASGERRRLLPGDRDARPGPDRLQEERPGEAVKDSDEDLD